MKNKNVYASFAKINGMYAQRLDVPSLNYLFFLVEMFDNPIGLD